jgi:hypothetical protein
MKLTNPITVLLAALLLATGCTKKSPATARLTSTTGTYKLQQSFDRAYATKTADGEYLIVLLDDGLPSKLNDDELLIPTAQTPVRQVLFVKMNWRAPRGAKNNSPAAANALARWYFFTPSSNPGEAGQDRIVRYDGTAFVRMSQGRDARWRGNITADNMTLATTTSPDNPPPPIQTATLSASFTAEADIARVNDLVSSLPAVQVSPPANTNP